MMTECRCKKCGHIIPMKRNYLDYLEKERGYKFKVEEYFLKCPKCNERQEVELNKIPFIIRWQLFKEKCLNIF